MTHLVPPGAGRSTNQPFRAKDWRAPGRRLRLIDRPAHHLPLPSTMMRMIPMGLGRSRMTRTRSTGWRASCRHLGEPRRLVDHPARRTRMRRSHQRGLSSSTMRKVRSTNSRVECRRTGKRLQLPHHRLHQRLQSCKPQSGEGSPLSIGRAPVGHPRIAKRFQRTASPPSLWSSCSLSLSAAPNRTAPPAYTMQPFSPEENAGARGANPNPAPYPPIRHPLLNAWPSV